MKLLQILMLSIVLFATIIFLPVSAPAQFTWHDKIDTGKSLVCPQIKDTIIGPIPGPEDSGGIVFENFSPSHASCGYFKKTGENSWDGVARVTAIWWEGKKPQQLDCEWDFIKKHGGKYLFSEKKQAYVEFSAHPLELSKKTREAADEILRQVEKMAISCP